MMMLVTSRLVVGTIWFANLLFLKVSCLEEVPSCMSDNCDLAEGHSSALLQVRSQPSKSEAAHDAPDAQHKSVEEQWVQSQLQDDVKTRPSEDSHSAEAAAIRLEMARRALMIVYEKEDTSPEQSEGTSPEQSEGETQNRTQSASRTANDQPEDVVHNEEQSGSTAELNEQGYRALTQCCCPLEMGVYAQRIITHFGFKVCNQGSLQGLVAWFYCKNQTRTFAELVDECMDAADGECAWVGTESRCPEMSKNCPHFPDTTGHRRRICNQRHVPNTLTTTQAPPVTNYIFKRNTHCGFYQDCNGPDNFANIDGGKEFTNTTKPERDCVSKCDAAESCAGFTYVHEQEACYYRKNINCGVFHASGNDCWVKP